MIQQWDTRVRYENDGTGLQEKTAAILIQSQAGIEQYGQLVFGYSSATEKLEVTMSVCASLAGKWWKHPQPMLRILRPKSALCANVQRLP